MKYSVIDSYQHQMCFSVSLDNSIDFLWFKGRERSKRGRDSAHQVHAVHVEHDICLVLLEGPVRIVENLFIVSHCIRGGDEARGVNET